MCTVFMCTAEKKLYNVFLVHQDWTFSTIIVFLILFNNIVNLFLSDGLYFPEHQPSMPRDTLATNDCDDQIVFFF